MVIERIRNSLTAGHPGFTQSPIQPPKKVIAEFLLEIFSDEFYQNAVTDLGCKPFDILGFSPLVISLASRRDVWLLALMSVSEHSAFRMVSRRSDGVWD